MPPEIRDLIGTAAPRLTPAERRIADAIIEDPKIVAFGTVAQLATRAGASGPSVLRFAAKLGFVGFVDLQAAVQAEIADQLRPATQRIRERTSGDVLERALEADLENVRATLSAVDSITFREAVALIGDRRHAVWVIASELGAAGAALATQLELLRDRVHLIGGSPVAVSRQLVGVAPDDVVVAIDVRRYERWVVDATKRAVERGARLVAITDGHTSPLAEKSVATFVVSARGVGPFDSSVGILALVHALGAALATRLRRNATHRLDAIESSWHEGQDLLGQ